MKLTVTSDPDGIFLVDIESSETVINLKAILEAQSSIPIGSQALFFNGRELRNSEFLNIVGVQEGDLLSLQVRPTPPRGGRTGGSLSIPNLQQSLSEITQGFPGIGNVPIKDPEAFGKMLREIQKENRYWQERLERDPFDVEAQKKLEEFIQQQNIAENEALALEYNPAQFTSVFMLYVPLEINNHKLKAFVDTGAQVTIISKSCAERCGIMRLCDTRYQGTVYGVGTDKIFGRIHNVQLKVGGNFYMCGFTVIEKPNIELIFGLDMLRRHQCSVDLKGNVLRFGHDDLAVPFLPEHEIPKSIPPELLNQQPSTTADPRHLGGTSNSERVPEPFVPQLPSVPESTTAVNLGPSSASQLPPVNIPNLEQKVARLQELGFDKRTVLEALILTNGNEDEAAGILFGG